MKRQRSKLERDLAVRDFCHNCGSRYQIVRKMQRSGLWGCATYRLPNGKRDTAKITVACEFTRCPKCKDEFYTYEQSMAHSRLVIRASWEVLKKRLGYKDYLWDVVRGKRVIRRQHVKGGDA